MANRRVLMGSAANLAKRLNKQLWRSAGLKMPIHVNFFGGPIFTSKVGQIDLVIGVRSGCVSRSVHAWLQVTAVCTGYNLCHPR